MTPPPSPLRLVMLTRYPEPGRAKTRLIPALGPDGAAAVHRRLAERTLATLRATGLPVEVWTAGATAERFAAWFGADTALVPQPEGDLGARMDAALRPAPAIVVGADVPTLATAHVIEAARLLAQGLVALGPAEDGGYYLTGLPAPAPFLFTDMPWGTAAVLAETIHRLQAHDTPYGLLPTLPDLDRPEDLDRFPDLRP